MDQPKKCDHKGYYKSAGVIQFPEKDGMLLMTILYCENCGDVVNRNLRVKGITIPQPGMRIPVDLSKRGIRRPH